MKYIKLFEEYKPENFIRNIKKVDSDIFNRLNYNVYTGDFGENGTISWQIFDLSNPKTIHIHSIEKNNPTTSKNKGEGTKAINTLFSMYPTAQSIIYDDESEGFWDAIGGNVDELTRENFYKYYKKLN